MKFATLIHAQELRSRVGDVLTGIGIEVLTFDAVDALIASLDTQSFAAIVLEDIHDRIGHWLQGLRIRTDGRIALIAIGTGGTAGMSRALVHGADDYVVVDDGAEQLVHRSIARINAKTQSARTGTWRLGPYTLDLSRSRLTSTIAEVHVSPRELLLARILLENHGRIVALERLCEDLCQRTDDAAKRAVKQHAHTLRKKCEVVAGATLARLRIEGVYGRGYRLSL